MKIAPEGLPFIAIAVVIAVIGAYFSWRAFGVLFLLAIFVTAFFRDPFREIPQGEGLVVSPADGKVVMIVPTPAGHAAGEGATQISIFLSVFDVHINRAPVAGRVVRSIYVPGTFLNAALDKASEENERRCLIIATPAGTEIAVVQIAGLIARRIVTFIREGDTVGAGERYGLIRFGSRVDTYLPPGRGALVAVGQRAIGGETVLADLKSDEPEREARVQ